VFVQNLYLSLWCWVELESALTVWAWFPELTENTKDLQLAIKSEDLGAITCATNSHDLRNKTNNSSISSQVLIPGCKHSNTCRSELLFIECCVYVISPKSHNLIKIMIFFFSFWCNWGLNSGLYTCNTGTLQLEPYLSPFFLIILDMEYWNYLPRLASNLDSPDLSLPSS
jgi:hypothetical protein